jgi:hypothetical protein
LAARGHVLSLGGSSAAINIIIIIIIIVYPSGPARTLTLYTIFLPFRRQPASGWRIIVEKKGLTAITATNYTHMRYAQKVTKLYYEDDEDETRERRRHNNYYHDSNLREESFHSFSFFFLFSLVFASTIYNN